MSNYAPQGSISVRNSKIFDQNPQSNKELCILLIGFCLDLSSSYSGLEIVRQHGSSVQSENNYKSGTPNPNSLMWNSNFQNETQSRPVSKKEIEDLVANNNNSHRVSNEKLANLFNHYVISNSTLFKPISPSKDLFSKNTKVSNINLITQGGRNNGADSNYLYDRSDSINKGYAVPNQLRPKFSISQSPVRTTNELSSKREKVL